MAQFPFAKHDRLCFGQRVGSGKFGSAADSALACVAEASDHDIRAICEYLRGVPWIHRKLPGRSTQWMSVGVARVLHLVARREGGVSINGYLAKFRGIRSSTPKQFGHPRPREFSQKRSPELIHHFLATKPHTGNRDHPPAVLCGICHPRSPGFSGQL